MPKRLINQSKRKIIIQKLISVEDELGQEVEAEWQDFKVLWATIKTMQGREYFAAATAQAENTYRFIIRYTTGITNDMRIIYKGRVFSIVEPPINDDELNKTLTILAKEKV
jgi:SPP1 family predicted phage head-tail adaptor